MSDASDEGRREEAAERDEGDPGDPVVRGTDGAASAPEGDDEDLEALRARVEEKYDFDDFGARDMAEMTAREWDAVFESDSWVTGDELLDRVADDLRRDVANRDVFAVIEEIEEKGERRLLAYSDEGYAVVYPDGSVAGFGTVLRDVKPVVALNSMDSYTPAEPPGEDELLPDPEDVPQGTGEFGNLMLQIVAGSQILVGLGLVGAWVYFALTPGSLTLFAPVLGILFVVVGIFLFATVANARLSDRFRAEEYRERLRAAGIEDGERPEFVPVVDGELVTPQERERASLEAVAEDPSGGAPVDDPPRRDVPADDQGSSSP